ncbi:MAG: type II toxin-antitoxin system HicB family antitoxin [Candidatus Hinthialibacter antarcticus]|nr:type II toxin-antitoxin system HicB family antitoxin [Candidatus Hinthialibacter antarcticus]
MMEYKGYRATPQYSADDKCFYGQLLGIRDCVLFEGRSVKELEKAFKEAVDNYLDECAEEGTQPQKPFSGRFNLRIDTDLHAKAIETASNQNKSLNQFISDLISKAVY